MVVRTKHLNTTAMITVITVGLVLTGGIGVAVTSAKTIVARIPGQMPLTILFVALLVCGGIGIVKW